jgi:zinc and cadmium transporter
MSLITYLAVYCLIVVAASLLGGYLPSRIALSHRRLQLIISGVAGLMLGVALLHLIPHAAAHGASLDQTMFWTLIGVLGTFFLMRAFHSHQHSIDLPEQHEHHEQHSEHDHHACGHGHNHGPSGNSASWIGIAAGLSVHTLIDGIALGAAVAADQGHDGWSGIPGLGTFLAVALHKPLDAVSITTLMTAQGWSARSRLVVNLGYSLMCPLGAALFVLGISESSDAGHVIGAALAFSAGVFICISLADLLPEIEFHSHDRLRLSSALVLGTILAYCIGFLEPQHHHGGQETEHGHDGHDHGHNHEHDHDHGHFHGHSGARPPGPTQVSPD